MLDPLLRLFNPEFTTDLERGELDQKVAEMTKQEKVALWSVAARGLYERHGEQFIRHFCSIGLPRINQLMDRHARKSREAAESAPEALEAQ